MREEALKKHMGKIMFSIVGILGLWIAVLIVYISKTSLRNTVEASKTNAVSIIDQYKTLRGYYVKSVIKKVKANTDLKISHDHKVIPNAIPLPATLIHDMSALLSRKGDDKIRLRLYSEYPFPNRKGRSLDGFAQEAIAYFKGNPDGVFVREGKMGGKEMVRVAIADKMVAQACVNCHNSRPDTPKADWKLNDVRGVLEVISPIDSQLANNSSMLNNMIGITLFAVVLLALLVVGIWMFIKSMVKSETEAAKSVAMMENTPSPTLFANLDFNIQYANPAAFENLKKLEQYTNVRAEDIIGKSIDIFHKDPPAARKIVGDPNNLPHKTVIDLGNEKFNFLATALYDNEKNYLGPMVTWEVVTEKLATERRARELAEREREFAEELKHRVDSMLSVVEAAAEGDLTQEISVTGEDTIGKMAEGLGKFLNDLRRNISTIGETAVGLSRSSEELSNVSQEMAGAAEETSNQATVVSSASEQITTNFQTVAAGAKEMSASIEEIAENANQAAEVAKSAVEITEITNRTVSKLGESSTEIGNVIKVITSIAAQAYLLALNATIEAARAGEAGKGFAVVANEAKELANQIAKAAEDICQKTQAIQTDTQGAVDAIAEISMVINQSNDISNTIASAVEEQSATTNEITRNVSHVAKGSEEITNNVAGVVQAVHQTSSGAQKTQEGAFQLSKMAKDLNEMVRQFKY